MDADLPIEMLLAAVARRDAAAARAIYEREGTRLFGIAMAILRDRPAASDALQNAFLRIWERAGQFDPIRGDGRGWLGGIVRHAALDMARARGRETPTADPGLGDEAVEPGMIERLAADQDGMRLRSCLAQLDERNRRLVVLSFVHGLSHAQISAKLDVPLGSVKSWIRGSLLSLRACLS